MEEKIFELAADKIAVLKNSRAKSFVQAKTVEIQEKISKESLLAKQAHADAAAAVDSLDDSMLTDLKSFAKVSVCVCMYVCICVCMCVCVRWITDCSS